MKKKILCGLLIVFIGIQFIRTNKKVTQYESGDDFLTQTNAPSEIASILKTSCYDCHSNKLNTPWYGQVAPVSWYLNDHINEARDELNFSAWGTFKDKRKSHKLEECVELIEDGEMPLKEYLWLHSAASLTSNQKTLLIDWFESIMKPEK